jgi:hypothetical protein
VRERKCQFHIPALLVVAAAAAITAACTSPAPVDLRPGAITFSQASVADGGTLDVSLPVDNLQPGRETASFTVEFRLSQTGTFTSGVDALVGSASVSSGIAGSSSIALDATVTIPEGLNVNGNVYIYAVVDPGGAIGETNDSNNISTVANAAVVLVFDDENASRTYPLVLRTYSPSGSGAADTLMGLYQNNAGTAKTVGSDVSGASDYSTIDRSGAGDELAPGTYSVVVVSWSGRNGPYAFLSGTANIAPRTLVELTSNAQDPGEPDDSPKPVDLTIDTTVPTAPVSIKVGAAMNRYSAAGDWDWFTFVLP